MITISKTAIGIAAGVAGTLFIGYCIYFDNKRRNDPDYKKKVGERRRRGRKTGPVKAGMPNLNDHEAIERYFLQEIQMGETLIARGDYEGGVEHLTNAIVVCGQPIRLLQVLQTSLQPQVFAMVVLKMQEIAKRQTSESNDGPSVVGTNIRIADNSSNVLESSSGPATIDDLE